MKAAVRSILEQTSNSWRLLVVDDGYPDPEVQRWFAAMTDSRVQYQRNENNLGANRNYVKCVGLVESEYFVVMGADDIALPNYVETVLSLIAANPGVSIIQPGVDVIDENGNSVSPLADRLKSLLRAKPGVHSGQAAAVSLMNGNWTYFPSLVWHTETVRNQGFRQGLNVSQDLALIIDVLCSGGVLLVDDDIVFHYRRHMASDSAVRALAGTRFDEEDVVMKSFAAQFSQLGWKRAARRARLRPMSRLNSLSLVPKALRHKRNPLPLLRRTFL